MNFLCFLDFFKKLWWPRCLFDKKEVCHRNPFCSFIHFVTQKPSKNCPHVSWCWSKASLLMKNIIWQDMFRKTLLCKKTQIRNPASNKKMFQRALLCRKHENRGEGTKRAVGQKSRISLVPLCSVQPRALWCRSAVARSSPKALSWVCEDSGLARTQRHRMRCRRAAS